MEAEQGSPRQGLLTLENPPRMEFNADLNGGHNER
jgi:hypothetical protein